MKLILISFSMFRRFIRLKYREFLVFLLEIYSCNYNAKKNALMVSVNIN